jgi:hypothetical protein
MVRSLTSFLFHVRLLTTRRISVPARVESVIRRSGLRRGTARAAGLCLFLASALFFSIGSSILRSRL